MSGIMTDGFPTTIEFSAGVSGITLSTVLAEKDVQPPGFDAGGENDTSTMRNTAWRTKQPKSLKTLTDVNLTCAYAPEVLTEMEDMVGVNQLITITFPDAQTWAFWGWINTFTPNAVAEGAQPECTIGIMVGNQNGSGVETGPVLA